MGSVGDHSAERAGAEQARRREVMRATWMYVTAFACVCACAHVCVLVRALVSVCVCRACVLLVAKAPPTTSKPAEGGKTPAPKAPEGCKVSRLNGSTGAGTSAAQKAGGSE
eukprot:9140212-Alexandrium_andersonii.AAC.1